MGVLQTESVVLRFDRGTVVCQGLPDDYQPELGGALVFDPRIRRFRGRAVHRLRIVSELRKRGYAICDEVDDHLPGGSAAWADVPLRDYQRAALSTWEVGGRCGILVLPTGAGKTRVAIGGLAATSRAALVLVPTRALVHQWRRELAAFHSDPIGVLGDGRHELRGVTVATFESARRWMHSIGNRFGVLVVDEAHHFGTGSGRSETLSMCTAQGRLGLTATPPAGPESLNLTALLGPVRFELSTADLMPEHLADLRMIELRLDLTEKERRVYRAARLEYRNARERILAVSGPLPWREFVALCRESEHGRSGLRAWHAARKVASWTDAKRAMLGRLLQDHRADRVLLFVHDRDAVYEIARTHWVMPISAETSRGEREWALRQFSDGRLRALVSARVLNEGIDVPDADVVVIVSSSHGSREFVQRVGRILRPRPGKTAVCYELVSDGTTEVDQAVRRRDALGTGRDGAVRSRAR